MQITFKNTTTKKQCQQFISILKKLKFHLSTKDRRIALYIDNKRNFHISTYHNRDLQNPPMNSPQYFIEYTFSYDFYTISNYSQQPNNQPYLFSIEIQDLARMITHYYQSKMSLMKLCVNYQINYGYIQCALYDDDVQLVLDLNVQKIQKFPKIYKNVMGNRSNSGMECEEEYDKEHIQYVTLFDISSELAEKFKQLENYNSQCWYQIHQNGIYLKSFGQDIQNLFILPKEYLKNYDSEILKKQLQMNIFLLEPNAFLLQEIRNCYKKKYQLVKNRLILIRHPTQLSSIKYSYLQSRSKLSSFSQCYKRTITIIKLSQTSNTDAFTIQQVVPNTTGQNLLKNQQNQQVLMKKIVINKWSLPNQLNYAERRQMNQRVKDGNDTLVRAMFQQEDTNTRKVFYKIEDD